MNTAGREALLRVPGLGVRSVERILVARRHSRLRLDDLARLRLSLAKVQPFVVAADHVPRVTDSVRLECVLPRLGRPGAQLELFH